MRKYLLLLLLISCYISFSQTTFIGTVKNTNNESINYGIVLVKSKGNILEFKDIVNGSYRITTSHLKFSIEINVMGYEKINFSPISIIPNKVNFKNFVLKSKAEELEVVSIKYTPLEQRTKFVYKAKDYLKGNEENVEDLLKNIPSLTIDKNGTIKQRGVTIQKVLIDGEDLLDRGYALLTKNMPVETIEKVEVNYKYVENELLRGITSSGKAVIDLKTNKKMKRLWFGTIKTNTSIADTENTFINSQANLIGVGNKSKHFFLTNYNNTGFETIGDLSNITDNLFYIENEEHHSSNKLSNIYTPSTIFSKNRTNFNNSKLVVASSNIKLSKKSKFKVQVLYNKDNNSFYKNAISNYNLDTINFTNKENSVIKNEENLVRTKLKYLHKINKISNLNCSLNFNRNYTDKSADLKFNDATITQNLDTKINFIKFNTFYTTKLTGESALIIDFKLSSTLENQKYKTISSNSVILNNQFNKIEHNISTLNLKYLNKISGNSELESNFGHTNYRNQFYTQFNENLSNTNDFFFIRNNSYLKNKYGYKNSSYKFDANLDFKYLNYKVENTKSNDFLVVNPKIVSEWKVNDENEFKLSSDFRTKIIDENSYYNNLINTSLFSFSKGDNTLTPLNSLFNNVKYHFGNTNTDLDFKLNYDYSYDFQFLSNKSFIVQDYSNMELIRLKGRNTHKTQLQSGYFINKLLVDLKLKLGYSNSRFKNIVNNSSRTINTNNYNVSFRIDTGFDFLNFMTETEFNYGIINNEISTFNYTTYKNTTEMSADITKKISAELNSIYYHLKNGTTNSNILFIDFNLNYIFNKNINFGLVGKNLLNYKKYNQINIADNYNQELSSRILPRYVLLKFDYNFK